MSVSSVLWRGTAVRVQRQDCVPVASHHNEDNINVLHKMGHFELALLDFLSFLHLSLVLGIDVP